MGRPLGLPIFVVWAFPSPKTGEGKAQSPALFSLGFPTGLA
ncbi:hypothetical protein [Spirosoma migulaei]